MSDNEYHERSSDIRKRNVLTPAGQSVAITGPSTHNNMESKAQFIPEGLSCFGNPTLETLQI